MIIFISFYNRFNTKLIAYTVTWFQSENKASKDRMIKRGS